MRVVECNATAIPREKCPQLYEAAGMFKHFIDLKEKDFSAKILCYRSAVCSFNNAHLSACRLYSNPSIFLRNQDAFGW